MCKVCLKLAKHTISIINLNHILHEIHLKQKKPKQQKNLQPIKQMHHTQWYNLILTATGTEANQHWYGYPSLTASQSHNECDYALLTWKNFSKAKIPTATNHISHLLS